MRRSDPPLPARRVARALALTSALLLLAGASPADASRLDAVQRKGELVLVTHASTTTYYEGGHGPAGFEYDLARHFAEHLGVRLRVDVVPRPDQVLVRLLAGDADFAAGGIALARVNDPRVRLTHPYRRVRLHFVYRRGSARPRDPGALIGREVVVPAGTIYAEHMRALAARHPDLAWREVAHRRPEELLGRVAHGRLDVALTDADTLAANRPYYPQVRVAFSLPRSEPLAWAFPAGADASLYRAANRYLAIHRRAGMIAHLVDRYYGPGSRANVINLSVFHERARERLPRYRAMFRRASAAHDLDWRLLAAIGYQESYWDPGSVSPTGVRGLMMLTRVTAREVGVRDRLDPDASISGGARYLRGILDRLPPRIAHPDRLWLALAAYNVGPSHLEDARILTEKLGGNPDRWSDVREHLPLLADPEWYPQTRYGQARGREPVRFVDRVRVYYRALQKLEPEDAPALPDPATAVPAI
jgi:membrane-bound lytic murein transglycosylase F